jgi:hypothetical protein
VSGVEVIVGAIAVALVVGLIGWFGERSRRLKAEVHMYAALADRQEEQLKGRDNEVSHLKTELDIASRQAEARDQRLAACLEQIEGDKAFITERAVAVQIAKSFISAMGSFVLPPDEQKRAGDLELVVERVDGTLRAHTRPYGTTRDSKVVVA